MLYPQLLFLKFRDCCDEKNFPVELFRNQQTMGDTRIVNQTEDYGSEKETIDDENTSLIQSGGMYKWQKKKPRLIKMFIATFVAALGSVCFGSCLGYSSSALQDLQSTSQGLHLSTSQGKWFSVS